MGGCSIILQSSTLSIVHGGRLCKLLILPIVQKGLKVADDCLESITYQSFTPLYIDRKDVDYCLSCTSSQGRRTS